MKKQPIVKYIEDLQKRKSLKDKDIAERLGIKPSSMHHLKHGLTIPSDINCLKLAEIASDPPEKVLLIAAESRAPKEARPFWHNILEKIV